MTLKGLTTLIQERNRELEKQNEELLRARNELTEELNTAREQIRKLDQQQEVMFKASPLGMVLLVDRIAVKLNQRFCEMLGYDREELIGHNSRMAYRSQEDFEQFGSFAFPILAAILFT